MTDPEDWLDICECGALQGEEHGGTCRYRGHATEIGALDPSSEMTHCTCEASPALVFDPDVIGLTVGNLARRGWLMCPACGKGWLTKRGTSYEDWTLAGGGASLNVGNIRIRAEGGKRADVIVLMARLAKLPELEHLLQQTLRRALLGVLRERADGE